MLTFKNGSVQNPSNKSYIWIGLSPLLIASLVILFTLLFSKFLPPKLPLFYSLPWGDKQLANLGQFFIIPSLISLIALTNLVILWQLHLAQSFFKNALLFASLVTTVILVVTFAKIALIFV